VAWRFSYNGRRENAQGFREVKVVGKKANAPDYFWLEPLRVLLNQTALWHPTFKWWQNIIGGSQGQELYHTDTFCEVGEGTFDPDWSVENLINFGPNYILREWAKARIRELYCDTGGGA
jgi:hypothetical protein